MGRLGYLYRAFRALACILLAASASNATAAGVAGFTAVALQKHDAGTFYISGSIRGYGDLRMLVDTGSSYVVISEVILTQLKEQGAARYSRDLQGIMADGTTKIIPMYRIAGLRLGESCWIHDVETAVFPGQTRPILGMNILARLAPFTFSAEPPQLAVARCQESPPTPADFTAVEARPAAPTAGTGLAP